MPAQLEVRGGTIHWGTKVRDIHPEEDGVRPVTVEVDGTTQTIRARLVVIADGGHGHHLLTTPVTTHEYEETGLIALVEVDRPLRETAWERFTLDGPAALLPRIRTDRPGYWSSIVWTVPSPRADAIKVLDDRAFLAQFQAHFGYRAGRFIAVDQRKAFPLRLRTVVERTEPRLAIIGNAAQTLHPIAGQGLNLGLRDAATLARYLARSPADIGHPDILNAFAAERQRDTKRTIAFTDALVKIFRNPNVPILAGLGLAALDFAQPIRTELAERMLYGAAPT
jgi:2-octaprenyl-6-methoxyphenol hydroxylase